MKINPRKNFRIYSILMNSNVDGFMLRSGDLYSLKDL